MSDRFGSPKALSLFSGAGGLDFGVHQAGVEILASIEIDPYCCETLRAWKERENLKTQVIENDIRTIEPVELMSELKLVTGELDLLIGGPPCQAFSQIGKRKSLQDERGLLLFQMVRFAEVFQPCALLIEQVKGLLNAPDHDGNKGGAFRLFLNELQELGYVPKWKVVTAADYGVPQLRQRVFIVATHPPNGFEFPSPTHAKPSKQTALFALPTYVTVGEALKGLGEPSKADNVSGDGNHVDITPAGDRRRIHGVFEGSHLAASHHLPEAQRGKLTKKDTTKFRRLSREEPSITLRGGEIFFHPLEDRYLTPREYMRLHGYPDDYVLKGPIRGRSGQFRALDQHRQVANSVPPPIAKTLTQSILRTIECHQQYLNCSAIP